MSNNARTNALTTNRVYLADALRARSEQIEMAVMRRVCTLFDVDSDDATLIDGVRAAVSGAVAYGLDAIENGEDWTRALPGSMVIAARGAARDGISLDMLLRCYAAGDKVLGEFVVEAGGDLGADLLARILRAQARTLDNVMAAIVKEYNDEAKRAASSAAQRRIDSVMRLLADEHFEPTDLGYELEGWHLGMVLTGRETPAAARDLAGLGYQLLEVPRGAKTVWAWLGGGSRKVAIGRVEQRIIKRGFDVSVAIGEVGRDLEGWRLTHAQAQAALWVSLSRPRPVTRYGDVLLLSAALQNSVLARSLGEIFLTPLGGKDGGTALRETLRAYFATGHNVKAAAARLGVDRGTVRRRIRLIEERLGRSLLVCQAELEVALCLDKLKRSSEDTDVRTVHMLRRTEPM